MTTVLTENLVAFGRVLRRLGLSAGPDAQLLALQVTERLGLQDRETLFWGLHAVYVHRSEERALFKEAFDRFFRDPSFSSSLEMLLPRAEDVSSRNLAKPGATRIHEAFRGPREPPRPREQDVPLDFDAAMTASNVESLRHKDFDQLSGDELRRVKMALRRMKGVTPENPVRRTMPRRNGKDIDARKTMQSSLRTAGDAVVLRRKTPRTRPRPLVVLCDISGSMERYSRMFLHLIHGVTNDRDRVHTFLFGTRLTPVTRWLRQRDPDAAMARIGQEVLDWSGGTRIGGCLREFNRVWRRRVLAHGAWVLLVTDGLDRDAEVDLGAETARLRRSCRRLVWLNPLLRYAGFQPKARGVAAILPHVDDFRPVHDLASLEQLASLLSRPNRERAERDGKHFAFPGRFH
ncbi:MAG: VWA domain-containing protein [Myxococcota bacterium]